MCRQTDTRCDGSSIKHGLSKICLAGRFREQVKTNGGRFGHYSRSCFPSSLHLSHFRSKTRENTTGLLKNLLPISVEHSADLFPSEPKTDFLVLLEYFPLFCKPTVRAISSASHGCETSRVWEGLRTGSNHAFLRLTQNLHSRC